MFRKIRRETKMIGPEETKELLHTARYGTVAVNGDDGYPYAVPVNYLYDEENNRIFFHGSAAGHKADAVRADDRVCFTVIGEEEIIEEDWAPFTKSAVVFGRCRILEDREETIDLVKELARKYFPTEELVRREAGASGSRVSVYVIEIEHISGKRIQEK